MYGGMKFYKKNKKKKQAIQFFVHFLNTETNQTMPSQISHADVGMKP